MFKIFITLTYRRANQAQKNAIMQSSLRSIHVEEFFLPMMKSLHPNPNFLRLGNPHHSIHRFPLVSFFLRIILSRTCPPTSNINPFRQATSLFAFNIYNICVTSTSTSYPIFLHIIPIFPILVFFFSFLLVQSGHLEERLAWSLARRCVCRTMLNGCMPITEITEVMNVPWCKKGTGSKRMDGCVSPLFLY